VTHQSRAGRSNPDLDLTWFSHHPSRARGARWDIHLQKEPVMTTGTVKFYNETKGYGFISPDDGAKDVFVHVSAVEASGLSTLDRDQKVEFEVEPDQRGPKAVNIKPL
jgi:CspA family cold shock protein